MKVVKSVAGTMYEVRNNNSGSELCTWKIFQDWDRNGTARPGTTCIMCESWKRPALDIGRISLRTLKDLRDALSCRIADIEKENE